MNVKNILSDLELAEEKLGSDVYAASSIILNIKGIENFEKHQDFIYTHKIFDEKRDNYLKGSINEGNHILNQNKFIQVVQIHISRIKKYCEAPGDCKYGKCNYLKNPLFMEQFKKYLKP